MEQKEIKDLVVSGLVIALAFGIALGGGFGAILSGDILITFLVALLTVTIAFIFHELGHRFVARRFQCYAEYKMWPQGLLLAVIFSFAGFVFAAPGAVMIHPRADMWGNTIPLSVKKMGLISIVGPLVNVLLAFVFLLTSLFVVASPILQSIIFYGIFINLWLAAFNLLPVPPLDGFKVFRWNKFIWAGLFAFIVIIGLLFFL